MAAAKIKSATSKVANAFPHPTITIQRNKHASPASSAGSSPTIAKTPKTPADEGIDFVESAIGHGEAPIRVYELPLEPDGGPSKSREVRLSFRCKRNYCHVDKPLLRLYLVYSSPSRRCSVYSPHFVGGRHTGI